MSELLCLLNAFIGALCMSACKKNSASVHAWQSAIWFFFKAQLNLLYSVAFACEGIMRLHAIWHSIGSDFWSYMHRTPIRHVSGSESSQPKRKTNGTKHTLKKSLQSCLPTAIRRVLRSNYQHTPTTRWLAVMQMQLASICIRQQLTDAQMANRQRRARHLWQRQRLAAILSEAVPIWRETTTLHYSDDGSSLGAAGARCCCCSLAFKAKHIQAIETNKQSSVWCKMHRYREAPLHSFKCSELSDMWLFNNLHEGILIKLPSFKHFKELKKHL